MVITVIVILVILAILAILIRLIVNKSEDKDIRRFLARTLKAPDGLQHWPAMRSKRRQDRSKGSRNLVARGLRPESPPDLSMDPKFTPK